MVLGRDRGARLRATGAGTAADVECGQRGALLSGSPSRRRACATAAAWGSTSTRPATGGCRWRTPPATSPFYQVVARAVAGALSAERVGAERRLRGRRGSEAMQYGSVSRLSRSTYSREVEHRTSTTGCITPVPRRVPDSRISAPASRYTRLLTKDLGVAARLRLRRGDVRCADRQRPADSQPELDIGLGYGRSCSLVAHVVQLHHRFDDRVIGGRPAFPGHRIGATEPAAVAPVDRAGATTTAGCRCRTGDAARSSRTPSASTCAATSTGGSCSVASPTYARGTVGLGPRPTPTTASPTRPLDVALGRRVALYGEHFYYRYQFANAVGLPAMLAWALNRKGARSA